MLKEKTYTVCVEKNKCGLRLDKVLVDTLEEFSRSRIQDLIIKGCVSLNREAAVSPSLKVREGDVFKITVPPPSEAILAPQKISLEVIFEDNNLVVLKEYQKISMPFPGCQGYPSPIMTPSSLVIPRLPFSIERRKS